MNSQGRIEIIRELCSFEGRLAGTDAERRAANRLAERLRAGGRRAEVEPTYVHPQWALVHGAHCLLGFVGSLVAIEIPALGFGLVLAAATSMYLDLNYRVYLIRSLFFRRASQNVVSPGPNPGAPARLIVCAHLDAGRSGAVFSAKRARRFAGLAKRYPWLGPMRVLFWSLALLLPILGARMAEVESGALSLLQLLPTLVLLIGIFALVEIQLSDVVPGANVNASGVATALSLAAELDTEPPANLDLWLVLAGAGESLQEGMRAFVRSQRKQIDPATTFMVAIESVGRGDVRYETSAGWAVSYAMDRRLVALASAIAESDGGSDPFRAEALSRGSAGDAMPARIAGWRTIAITCRDSDGYVPDSHLPSDLPAAIDESSLDRAHRFTLELVRRLDRDLDRRTEAAA